MTLFADFMIRVVMQAGELGATALSPNLLRIDECPDLLVDGYVGDEHGNLVFLSLWGRDTAVQQFVARLTLGRDPPGMDAFHLVLNQASVPIFVGDVERLDKRMTRAFRRTLFGSLVHLWLFDRCCVVPDKSNASALALCPKDGLNDDRLWQLVQATCPLPLLPHWQAPVLPLLRAKAMLSRLPMSHGSLQGYRLAIDVPVLTQALGNLIRSGALNASDQASAAEVLQAA